MSAGSGPERCKPIQRCGEIHAREGARAATVNPVQIGLDPGNEILPLPIVANLPTGRGANLGLAELVRKEGRQLRCT